MIIMIQKIIIDFRKNNNNKMSQKIAWYKTC